jgi:hypothetical protein
MADSEELGAGTGRQGPWARGEDDRADKQEGDPRALDVEGDPRGGVQSDEYRHADPTDIVEEGDTTMSGPGGAPQDDRSIEERREESADMRDAAVNNPPTPRD